VHGVQAMQTREDVVDTMNIYLANQLKLGVPAKHVSRHMLGLFQGVPGAKRWRRYISENAHLDPANARLLEEALSHLQAVQHKFMAMH
jgi:tRNA-dihydrouridine synthase A